MLYLVAASLLWAFSFGLIKGELTGLDPVAVAAVRLLLAAALFAPWLLRARLNLSLLSRAAGLGVVQFGLMYVLYIASYRWLPAYLVALYTIFTPLYVVLLDDLLKRRWRPRHLLAALLAVAGAAVVHAVTPESLDPWPGILLLQGANLCFAAGQLGYRDLRRRAPEVPQAGLLGGMYLGAFAFAAAAFAVLGASTEGMTGARVWAVLLYLGVLPTGLGLFLWNVGAARVGAGTLAVANNLKIPLAVLSAWWIFGEQAAYWRVLGGMAILLTALVIAARRPTARGRRPVTAPPLVGDDADATVANPVDQGA